MADLHASVRSQLLGLLEPVEQAPEAASSSADAVLRLEASLRLLAKWRSHLIQNTLLQDRGVLVSGGPFAGMHFVERSAEGCHVPKLLGCYEQPLHPFLEGIQDADYELLINIGCAEGYYAVGMARRFPALEVLAFDTNRTAQDSVLCLAKANGVADRVQVGGTFEAADFARYAQTRTLVICDIEGAEAQLLDPQLAPALAGFDLLVEAHDCFQPGLSQQLVDRFAASHSITVVPDSGGRSVQQPPAWFSRLSHLDQLLATWEWRSGPTPWLILRHALPGQGSPLPR